MFQKSKDLKNMDTVRYCKLPAPHAFAKLLPMQRDGITMIRRKSSNEIGTLTLCLFKVTCYCRVIAILQHNSTFLLPPSIIGGKSSGKKTDKGQFNQPKVNRIKENCK